MTDNLRFVPAWKRNDARLEADAVTMWRTTGVLPANINLEQRAKELCVQAYVGDRLVAITTADIQLHAPVRQRFAFGRIFVHPEFERSGLALSQTLAMREELREWSKANPYEQVAGWAIAISAKGYGKTPITSTGGVHAGYNADGQQVRLYWFDHFRLPVV